MKSVTRCLLVSGLLLSACQSDGPQIARYVASPIVLPFPPSDQFRLKATVKNFGEEPWEGGSLRVYGFYFPQQNDTVIDPQKTVFFEDLEPVPPLGPGAEVEVFAETPIESFPVQAGSIPAKPCAKPACNGHVHLILEDRGGAQLAPPNTHISIDWPKSGATKDIVVHDEGR